MIGAFPTRPRTIGIIGGGSAGYLTALALRVVRPDLDVTVVRSDKIPIIGVGESTTPLVPHLLHGVLGVDPASFHREVRPTWKLGVRFEWGPQEAGSHFNYSFGHADLADAEVTDGHIRRSSVTSMLMDARRVPIAQSGSTAFDALLRQPVIAYHLDNARFARFLAERASRRGVHTLNTTVEHVEQGATGVRELVCEGGLRRSFDLYVDCTGFTSLVMGKALGVPFRSYESSLICDMALVGRVPGAGADFGPYTTAHTMPSGWMWHIPQRGVAHIGYVFSSDFATTEEIAGQMAARYPAMSQPRLVPFRPGRRDRFVAGNVVAIGNAYGFVEPLEATSLHMVVIQIGHLLDLIRTGGADAGVFNERVGRQWDYLRWFLAVHYRFNERLDSPFWRACRTDVDITGLEHEVDDFRRRGPRSARAGAERAPDDPLFGPRGLDTLLLGQGVPSDALTRTMPAGDWSDVTAARQGLVDLATEHADGLDRIDVEPDLLDGFVDGIRERMAPFRR